MQPKIREFGKIMNSHTFKPAKIKCFTGRHIKKSFNQAAKSLNHIMQFKVIFIDLHLIAGNSFHFGPKCPIVMHSLH